jgi:hypothetical protein
MKRRPLRGVGFVLVLLVSTLGLFFATSDAKAEDRPAVLLIARGDSPRTEENGLKIGIDVEVHSIISKLYAFGYAVDVASESGKDINIEGSTLKVDKKLADVQVEHYVGVIIPCMTTISLSVPAITIVRDMHARNLPIAAQDGGVKVLDAAGILKGRNHAKDGIFKGVGVVRDGDVVTSGVCPYLAQISGLRDDTDQLVTTFVTMLKK